MFINTPEGERFEITDKKIVNEVLNMIVCKRPKTEIVTFVNKLIEIERSKTIEYKRKIWYESDEKLNFIQKVKNILQEISQSFVKLVRTRKNNGKRK